MLYLNKQCVLLYMRFTEPQRKSSIVLGKLFQYIDIFLIDKINKRNIKKKRNKNKKRTEYINRTERAPCLLIHTKNGHIIS